MQIHTQTHILKTKSSKKIKVAEEELWEKGVKEGNAGKCDEGTFYNRCMKMPSWNLVLEHLGYVNTKTSSCLYIFQLRDKPNEHFIMWKDGLLD